MQDLSWTTACVTNGREMCWRVYLLEDENYDEMTESWLSNGEALSVLLVLVETGVMCTRWWEFNQEENKKKGVEKYLGCGDIVNLFRGFPRQENYL